MMWHHCHRHGRPLLITMGVLCPMFCLELPCADALRVGWCRVPGYMLPLCLLCATTALAGHCCFWHWPPPLTVFSPVPGLPSWFLVLYLCVVSRASAPVLPRGVIITDACNTAHYALLLYIKCQPVCTVWCVSIAIVLGCISPSLLKCVLQTHCCKPGSYC